MDLATVYAEHHAQLVNALRAHFNDHDLAEEVAARLWLHLVANPHLLHRYDRRRASLGTYLSVLAKSICRTFVRGEHRLRERGHIAARREATPRPAPSIDGFEQCLTPAESLFFQSLTGTVGPVESSKTNEWQLRHRIRRKLLNFLECSAVDAGPRHC